MHYMQILEVSQEPDPPKVTYKFPYFVNVSSSGLSWSLVSDHWVLMEEGELTSQKVDKAHFFDLPFLLS